MAETKHYRNFLKAMKIEEALFHQVPALPED